MERRVRVASREGLFGSSAAGLAAAAEQLAVTVMIRRGHGQSVKASSVLGLMTLGAQYGDEVILSAHGSDAAEALEDLAGLLSTAM